MHTHEFHATVDQNPNKIFCINCNKTMNLYDDYNEILAMLNAAELLSAKDAGGIAWILRDTGDDELADVAEAYAKARGE